MLLLIDNYDSFTFNLVHYFQMLGVEVRVVRQQRMTAQECIQQRPSYLVISPGPGHPRQARLSMDLMKYYAGKIPILGVCLGHQCLAEIHGGYVGRAHRPIHGKTSAMYHEGQGVFAGLSQGFAATRYHSLVVERSTLPPCLEITAETKEGEIMGLRHKEHKQMEGIQFHPESILSKEGMSLLRNFINQGVS